MSRKKIILIIIAVIIVIFSILYFVMIQKPAPSKITYGVSFNTPYAFELGLDWKDTYDAIVDDLNVKHLRLSAHWDLVEPKDNKWNFKEIDYQVEKAQEVGADIIFAVGRRLPRWPECHTPEWAQELEWEEQKDEILEYIEVVVNRYKNFDNIIMWQVENEPFLNIFANEHCGNLDVEFFEKEIEFVKSLDSSREVLVTDSSDLSLWNQAYQRGDVFGTTMYLYVSNKYIGPTKNLLPSSWYRAKIKAMEWLYGEKESMIIELSAEPWLLQSVVDTPLDLQLKRMSLDKFDEVIRYAENTRFDKQYLWGAEWWYYLKENGIDEYWEKGKEVFN